MSQSIFFFNYIFHMINYVVVLKYELSESRRDT